MCFDNPLPFVFLIIATAFHSEADSSTLRIKYRCHGDHIDAAMELLPNEKMRNCLEQNTTLKWWRYFNMSKDWKEVFPEPNSQFEEKDSILIIHDLLNSGNGTYTVECQRKEGQPLSSAAFVNIPDDLTCVTPNTTTVEITQTFPASSLGEQHTSEVLNGTVLVVIAVCAVIIVIVIAGTILLVLRKRAAVNAGLSRLASHKSGSNVNFQEENEPSEIYHEIDIENDKGNNCSFNSSTLTLLTLQNSPALPKRPANAKRIIKDIESEYDLIKEETSGEVNKSTTQVRSKDNKLAPNDDGYATILEEERLKDGKTCALLNNNTVPEYAQVQKHPEYAQVRKHPEYAEVMKRHVSNDTAEQSEYLKENVADTNKYSVVFPAIDYANVVKSLRNDTERNENAIPDDLLRYCNAVSKRKSEARASRKSLQYAILDHTNSEASLSNFGLYDLPSLVNIATCQYASIDFDKKAFVAPIRKAPSSWYKRNNKQNNKI